MSEAAVNLTESSPRGGYSGDSKAPPDAASRAGARAGLSHGERPPGAGEENGSHPSGFSQQLSRHKRTIIVINLRISPHLTFTMKCISEARLFGHMMNN